jgi:hypothetical protein
MNSKKKQPQKAQWQPRTPRDLKPKKNPKGGGGGIHIGPSGPGG